MCIISFVIGDLCKGSTTDSDSVCEGSNPSSPAKNRQLSTESCRFLLITYFSEQEYKLLDSACTSIRVMLISSINTAKKKADKLNINPFSEVFYEEKFWF